MFFLGRNFAFSMCTNIQKPKKSLKIIFSRKQAFPGLVCSNRYRIIRAQLWKQQKKTKILNTHSFTKQKHP